MDKKHFWSGVAIVCATFVMCAWWITASIHTAEDLSAFRIYYRQGYEDLLGTGIDASPLAASSVAAENAAYAYEKMIEE